MKTIFARAGIITLGALLIGNITGSVIAEDGVLLSADPLLRHAASLEVEMPAMDAKNGRVLFATKGCVICHAVNGVGGRRGTAPALDAARMALHPNPFEFSARMWSGAEAMIALQKEDFNYRVEITADELADIFAFVHDEAEQILFVIPGRP